MKYREMPQKTLSFPADASVGKSGESALDRLFLTVAGAQPVHETIFLFSGDQRQIMANA